MIRKISFKISNYLYKQTEGTHVDRSVFYFVFQFILSTLLETVLIIGLAILLNCLIEIIVVLIVFIPLRQSQKGLHMNSYTKCTITSTLLFLSCGLISKYFGFGDLRISMLFSIVSGLCLFGFLCSKFGNEVIDKWNYILDEYVKL